MIQKCLLIDRGGLICETWRAWRRSLSPVVCFWSFMSLYSFYIDSLKCSTWNILIQYIFFVLQNVDGFLGFLVSCCVLSVVYELVQFLY